jgi:hypothetical protein
VVQWDSPATTLPPRRFTGQAHVVQSNEEIQMSVKKAAAIGAAVVGMVAMGAGSAMASAGAEGVAAGSPGVISGNEIQIPVHVPINLCGDTIDVIGLINPDYGNTCINADMEQG